ncbi:hypothetical protein [Nitrosovibrio sp. Nv4]|uniref:hypothetical protein n=1 Tax=Nitrosovibrio sp. Nv4 TaxID=1945880 RepID=UPI0011806051|nr:hypothetical protein [Nitrosovibrio sp. Nv4]
MSSSSSKPGVGVEEDSNNDGSVERPGDSLPDMSTTAEIDQESVEHDIQDHHIISSAFYYDLAGYGYDEAQDGLEADAETDGVYPEANF